MTLTFTFCAKQLGIPKFSPSDKWFKYIISSESEAQAEVLAKNYFSKIFDNDFDLCLIDKSEGSLAMEESQSNR